MSVGTARWLLERLLLLSGAFLMLAFLAVLLPTRWMASAHQGLGMGEFPIQPITNYLTRSTSLLYGVHGVLMFYTGLTLIQHWRLVWLLGWLHVAIGLTMLAIDISSPMPWYWIAAEGGPVAGLGGVLLWLANRAFPESESI